MTDRLNQFQWTLAEAGYEFKMLRAVSEPSEQLYLTASVPVGTHYPGRRYAPPSGLFKNLAELKPQQKRIQEFANRW